MRDLVELKKATREFTNIYLEHIYTKVRFDAKLEQSRGGSKYKNAVDIAAAMAHDEARQSLERLDDEIVWGYMTHLGVDTDFDEHFDLGD